MMRSTQSAVSLGRRAVRVLAPVATLCLLYSPAALTAEPSVALSTETTESLTGVTGLDKARMLATLAHYYRRSDGDRASTYAQQALELLQQYPDAATTALAKDSLAWSLLMKARYDEALALTEEALVQADLVDDSKLSGQIYYTRGATNLNRGNITLALQSFKQAAGLLEHTDAQVELARTYSAIGSCYRRYTEYEDAMSWQRKAYDIAIQTSDRAVQSAVMNNLGVLYSDIGQPATALQYYLQSMDLDRSENFNLVVKLGNIGDMYREVGEYQRALESYKESLALNRKLRFTHHEADILKEIGTTYLAMGNLQQALNLLNQSLVSARQLQVDSQIVGALSALSKTHVAMENHLAAIDTSEQALALAETMEEPAVYGETLEIAAHAFKAAGDYERALDMFERYNRASERLLTDIANDRLAEVQNGLEAEVKEWEITRLQRENQIRLLQLEQQRNQRMFWIVVSCLLITAIVILIRRYKKVRRKSLTDELTRIPNRSCMTEYLEQEMRRFRRYRRPCCVMLADIDDFKSFNDTYGHDCGDHVLAEVAQLMRKGVRDSDWVSRWGGEEFLVLLPETSLEKATQVAELLRKEIESHDFCYAPRHRQPLEGLRVRITAGLATFLPGDEDSLAVLSRADDALYAGKAAGKNRIQLDSGSQDCSGMAEKLAVVN
ncbi:MAG: diguanylate cyclase [Halieaceae bacterium]|nr:diguanylate cyclase [Halieaceae bacterium]